MPKSPFDPDAYVVNPDHVAEALLARIDQMADERARFRRSLIYSVEMIEAPDFDPGAVGNSRFCTSTRLMSATEGCDDLDR